MTTDPILFPLALLGLLLAYKLEWLIDDWLERKDRRR